MSFLCQNLQKILLARKRIRNWSVWWARSALVSAKKLFEFGRWRSPLGAATGKFWNIWIHGHYLNVIFMSKCCKFSFEFEQILKNFSWLLKFWTNFFALLVEECAVHWNLKIIFLILIWLHWIISCIQHSRHKFKSQVNFFFVVSA